MINIINLNTQFIKNCIPFISKNEFRPYLTGVHIYKVNNIITYEATNGHILYKAYHEDIEAPDFDFILQGDFKKLKSKQLFVELDLNTLILDSSVVLRKIQAEFCDTSKVIPADDTPKATHYVKIQSCYLKVAEDIFGLGYELLNDKTDKPCLIKGKNELMAFMAEKY